MALDIHAHRILILDFGSQYTQLIARRVREIGVYCELHPFDMDDEAIREFNPRGIILAGGPESVHEANSPRAPQAVFDLNVPVLGICYGMQTMAEQMGGKVEGSDLREFGYVLPRDFASIEFVNARVAAIGLTEEAKLPHDARPGSLEDAVRGSRPVYFEDAGDFVESAVYERVLLRNGVEFGGPAIVEQLDSTVVVPPGAHARVDEYLNIVISVNGR